MPPAPINAAIASINKPSDIPRSFVRLGLGIHANAVPNPSIPAVAGATPRPGFPASAGNRLYVNCFALTPNGSSTDYWLEVPYSPEILAQSCNFRASILSITQAVPAMRPLPGAVPLAAPVDNAEQAAYDYAIALGGTARARTDLTGKTTIVVTGNIPMSIADLLTDGDGNEGGGGFALLAE
jgi:hypothetical protein